MNVTAPVALPPDIFDRNLAVLRRNDPALADRLTCIKQDTFAAEYPPLPTTTRDGQVNFRLRQADGTEQWFGRISIPSVRAAAVLAKFDVGQGNVLLAGIGEGSEVYLLSQRLGQHRAIFVWEEDPRAITLAMHLHDYAQALADERIVLLTGPLAELSDTLVNWLEKHPGHMCPNRLMLWPWQIPMDLADVQATVESAYSRGDQHRERALLTIREQLTSLPSSPSADTPSYIALLSARVDPETWFLVDMLSQGAADSGWSSITIDVRKPSDVHPLARAEKLAKAGTRLPDQAILIDLGRHEVNAFLPEKVPTISWLSTRATVKSIQPQRLASTDFVAVTCPYLRDEARKIGISESRLSVIPPPCLKSVDAAHAEDIVDRPIDVAIFANLGPTEAAVFGYTLTTPRNIWNTVVDLLSAEIENYTDQGGRIDTLFARAEEKLHVRIEDNDLRKSMIESLENWVAPRLRWKHIAQCLVDNDITIDIHGFGWPDKTGAQIHPPVLLEQQVAVLRQSKLMIHADLHGTVSATAMLAAGNGAVVLAQSHPRDNEPGGLCSLLKNDEEMVRFANIQELIHTIHRLLRNDTKRQKIATHAIKRCQMEHLPANRLKQIKIAASSFFRILTP